MENSFAGNPSALDLNPELGSFVFSLFFIDFRFAYQFESILTLHQCCFNKLCVSVQLYYTDGIIQNASIEDR